MKTSSVLTLNISETDSAQDLSLARDVARSFRVASRKADEIIAEVVLVVRGWRVEAEQAHLSRAEQERTAPALSRGNVRHGCTICTCPICCGTLWAA